MMETGWVSIVALLGWIVLAISAFASFRLSWSKALQLGLVWLAIFAGLFVLALVGGAAL